MSAQSDTAPESGGKGSFPREHTPGRQQRYYDGYDQIDWSKPDPRFSFATNGITLLFDIVSERRDGDFLIGYTPSGTKAHVVDTRTMEHVVVDGLESSNLEPLINRVIADRLDPI